jgi:AcrR family transcriptional regulator
VPRDEPIDVYYHFESRDALLGEVKQWVGQRLSELLMGEGNPARSCRRW